MAEERKLQVLRTREGERRRETKAVLDYSKKQGEAISWGGKRMT